MLEMKKNLHLALCFQIPQTESADNKSTWMKLIPKGDFKGIDGRKWSNNTPESVLVNSAKCIPWDIEHATHLKGPLGDDAQAYGWVEEFEIREGAIWGRVEFNTDGQSIISEKKYRFYSPAFLFDQTGNITIIKSVGFTNEPNLAELPALNRRKEQELMKLNPLIAAALSLSPETATITEAVAAIELLKTDKQLALNRTQSPDLTLFVPTATYQLALNRAERAEEQIKTQQDTETETLVNDAITAAKIAPANKEAFLAMCRSDRAGFENFIAGAQQIVSEQSQHSKKQEEQIKLNEHELAMCRKLNITQKDYLAAKHVKQG